MTTAKEVRDFFQANEIQIPSRMPRGMNKADYQLLFDVYSMLDKKDSSTDFTIVNKMKMVRLSKEEIIELFSANEKSKPDIQVGRYATYLKRDTSAYSVFEDSIKLLEEFFSKLKGHHSKAIHGLKIKFVKATDMKATAKYKQDEDTLWINSGRINSWVKQGRLSSLGSEEYGSLLYIVLHELGHRYLAKVKKQKWDIDSSEWITTDYSKTDTFTGEEKFAELFAMSNWKSKYSKYKDKIDKFESMLESRKINPIFKNLYKI